MKREGLFKRRGSPQWQMRYADETGKIVRASTGTTSKKLAREILAKRKTLVAEGRHLDIKRTPRLTFHELCDRYWETWGKHKRMKGLSSMIALWKAGLGNVALGELSQQRIEQFLNERLEEGISPSTRNRHLTMLRALFNKAREWELVEKNPTANIPRLRENGMRTRFLDLDEIRCLIEASSPDFRPVVITALHTGMRRGEILNLRWKDVDFTTRLITVQESKSGRKRMIPMDETLCATLRDLPSRFQKGFVFPSPVKNGQRRFDFQRAFHGALRRANIEDLRFHDLRHTFASHLVMNGVDIKTVQELLGHADLTMTMRYAHLAPIHRTRAIAILDTALRTDAKTDTLQKAGNTRSG